MSYEYDAFFSYKRDPQSDSWHETVKEKLLFWLRMELHRPDVRIFFDTEDIRTGARWQQKLADSLRRSKCIVCVWSPLYFQSKWCVSEWRTFLEREKACQRELVIPAAYHDGESFPGEATAKQMADFSNYTSIMPRFWDTELAVEFENKRLKSFAKDLATLIKNSPTFDPHFPLIEAENHDVMQERAIDRIAGV